MRRLSILSILFVLFVFPMQAFAGPEGAYQVFGTSPGGGNEYEGVVAVERNGDTYVVVWEVGGTEFIGTGLGAANVKGVVTMGPASGQDTALTVSYISEDSFGLAFYVERDNGEWEGIWTFGGSENIGTEVWVPIE